MQHPKCGECREEIETLESTEVKYVDIADEVEWEFIIQGDCPKCGARLQLYGCNDLARLVDDS